MTETQFIERLHQELSNSQHWPEIQAITSSTADPSLAPNELLVHPITEPTAGPIVLRVTVEGLVPPL